MNQIDVVLSSQIGVEVLTEAPKLSVIIPARLEEGWIDKYSLPSLCNQSFTEFEVIVVEDKTTEAPDRTSEAVSEYNDRLNIRVIPQYEASGVGGARNIGARQSLSENLVYLDADCRVTPNALEAVYDVSKLTDHIGACCPIYIEGDSDVLNDLFRIRNLITKYSIELGSPKILGSFCFYKKSLVLSNPWREGRVTGEDHLFSTVAGRMGKIAYLEDVNCVMSDRKIRRFGLKRSFLMFCRALFAELNGSGVSMDDCYKDAR